MPTKKLVLSSPVVLALACVVACSSLGTVPRTPASKITAVSVRVETWPEGHVEATLTDRYGRRCGWTLKGTLREIRECGCRSDWEDGIPNPRPDEADSAEVAEWEEAQRQDSIYAASNPLPLYHDFSISDYHDAATPVSLIDQGKAELRLDPISAGTVHLSIRADGIGLRARRDTTSAVIAPGNPQRWRLTWKVAGDSCVLKMSRIEERRSVRPSGR